MAQKTISNLIGRDSLYFDNTYTVGAVIVLDDDFRGTVVDVGIRSTTTADRQATSDDRRLSETPETRGTRCLSCFATVEPTV